MTDQTILEPYWPVTELKNQDLYFYLEAIEEYLPGNRVRVAGHGDLLMLGGNSYLGLNRHPKINEAAREAIDQFGTGTQGVRMLAGTLSLHRELEERIARFAGTEASATFSSGYLANVSTVACMVGRQDVVICDKLDHASIVDGCRLSGANLARYRHNDMNDLEARLKAASAARRKLVVVDGVFSMDGDVVNLPDVSRLCQGHGAVLMVDEAHAIGVLGETGRGTEQHFGLPPGTIDIKMGTLSKVIPSVGGYVAGTAKLCEFLNHQARGFIYSAALTPPSAAAALAAFEVMEEEPERVQRLQRNARHLADLLSQSGLDHNGQTPIFPIICGDDGRAWRLARYCQRHGIYVQAIPHPVVPKGTARLRAAVAATHTAEELILCAGVLHRGALEIAAASDAGSNTATVRG